MNSKCESPLHSRMQFVKHQHRHSHNPPLVLTSVDCSAFFLLQGRILRLRSRLSSRHSFRLSRFGMRAVNGFMTASTAIQTQVISNTMLTLLGSEFSLWVKFTCQFWLLRSRFSRTSARLGVCRFVVSGSGRWWGCDRLLLGFLLRLLVGLFLSTFLLPFPIPSISVSCLLL